VARFGNALSFGYQDEGFTMPFLRGAHMLLLEPTKSLILFAPVALLFPWAFNRLWHHDRPALFLIASTFIITSLSLPGVVASHMNSCRERDLFDKLARPLRSQVGHARVRPFVRPAVIRNYQQRPPVRSKRLLIKLGVGRRHVCRNDPLHIAVGDFGRALGQAGFEPHADRTRS
jgi:hypothetical protein